MSIDKTSNVCDLKNSGVTKSVASAKSYFFTKEKMKENHLITNFRRFLHFHTQ